jgi:tetratricopeptide (TPR) repeat protein
MNAEPENDVTKLRSRYPLSVRVSLVLLALLVAIVLIAFRYRTIEMHFPLAARDISGRIAQIRYLMADYDGAAKLHRQRQAVGYSNDKQQDYPGISAYLTGDLRAAEREANSALTLNTRNFRARVMLGLVAYDKGEYAKAYELTQTNIALGAAYPFNSQLLGGLAQAKLGNRTLAITLMNKASRQMSRGNLDAFVPLLLTHIAEAQTDIVRVEPAYVGTLIRVLSFWDPQATADAADYARRSLQLNKQLGQSYLLICAHHYQQRDFNAALAACEAGEKHEPDNIDLVWMRAYVLSARGDTAAEVTAVLRAFAIEPTDYFVSQGTMQVLQEKIGDFPKSLALGTESIKQQPNAAHMHEWVGRAESFLGNDAASLIHYRQAQLLDPTSYHLLVSLAQAALSAKQYDEAIKASSAAIRINGRANNAYEILGDAYVEKNDRASAITAYETGYRLQAPTPKQLSSLCVTYLRASKYVEAASCVEKVLQQDPSNVLAARLRYEVNLNRSLVEQEKKDRQK